MKDGGPAFPSYRYDGKEDVWLNGMTLRDYFAASALQGLLANTYNNGCKTDGFTYTAYQLADAMLIAREKEQK